MPPDWLQPDWPAPANVRAVFSSRSGGVSNPPWDSFNLGSHVGDAPPHVADNRLALRAALGSQPVFLNQVHGVAVADVTPTSLDGMLADACVSTQSGVACTIMVADCLPVLFTTPCGTAVAAAHAGWRGLAGRSGQGVLESTVTAIHSALKRIHAADHEIRAQEAPEIIAWLGPCIGPSAFEVGAEVKAAFTSNQADADQHFANRGKGAEGKYLADLAGLARARLRALGVNQVYGNDSSVAWCTVSNPSRYFSHRRDAGITSNGLANGFGTTGRMAACVWLV